MRLNQAMDRRLAAIEGKVIPPKTRTVTVWRDGCGEDKSEQIIAEMRADGRLTEQDRLRCQAPPHNIHPDRRKKIVPRRRFIP